MRSSRILCLAVALVTTGLSLSACNPPGDLPKPGEANDAVATAQTAINITCAAFPIAQAGFIAFAGAFPEKVSAEALKWDAGVAATMTAACAAKPELTNYKSILATVTAALYAVTDYVTNNRPPAT